MIEVIDDYHKELAFAQGYAHFFVPFQKDEEEESEEVEAKVVSPARKGRPKKTEGVETK
jgi:hypothetical protein